VYASYKVAPTNLAEVCEPVHLIHTFTNFNGTFARLERHEFPLGLWRHVWLSGHERKPGEGSHKRLDVTCTCRWPTGTNLLIHLDGLNSSMFSNMTTVTNGLVIEWDVAVLEPGRVAETSTLLVPAAAVSPRRFSGMSAVVAWGHAVYLNPPSHPGGGAGKATTIPGWAKSRNFGEAGGGEGVDCFGDRHGFKVLQSPLDQASQLR